MISAANEPAGLPSLLRRRQDQLRREVEHAALALFAQRGYEAVTVEEIAAAAGISARTFYRHFPTKEEVLVGELRRAINSIAGYIEARPPKEPVVATLRRAILSQVRDDDREAFADWAKVISSDPLLFARVSGIAAAHRRVITELLAARLGVDPATHLQPGVIAASMLAAAEHALRLWLAAVSYTHLDVYKRQVLHRQGREDAA